MIDLSELKSRAPALLQVAPKWVNLGFVCLIAYSLAQLTWRIIDPAANSAIVAAPLVRTASPNRPPPDYAAEIVRRHLFGQAAVTGQAGGAIGTIDRPTSLPLRLVGIYATDKPEDALAIINTGPDERVFGIGDPIISGAILRQVLPDRAVIERNGVLEAVFLPKDEGISLSSVVPLPPPTTSPQPTSSEPQTAGELRTQIVNNPRKLREMADFEGAEDAGKFVGYRISSKGNDALFSQFGLQSGDVVTSVNGISLDAPEKGAAALRELAKANDVTLIVKRNGANVVIQRPLN